MPKLNIVGWRRGLLKISMTKVLRQHLSYGLKDAKDCVDDVLRGNVVSFMMETSEDATSLAIALSKIGAIVEIEPDS